VRIKILHENDPENSANIESLIDTNTAEQVKMEIYYKAQNLKQLNHINEELAMIKLIEPFIHQNIKWYFLHLKQLGMLKTWPEGGEEKFNFRLLPEDQILKDKNLSKQITHIFNLQTEKESKEKNHFIQISPFKLTGANLE
jgi:hypothetical protein